MESRIPTDFGKNDSPSHENIAHLQSMKRDIESLEDFEDITKDVPSMKDVTAQFLQFEAGDKYSSSSNNPLFPIDDHFQFEKNQNNDLFPLATSNMSEFDSSDKRQNNINSDVLEPFSEPFQSLSDTQRTDEAYAKLGLDETNQEAKKQEEELLNFLKNEESPDAQKGINTLEDNNLLKEIPNDENLAGSEDLSFVPKKKDSIPAVPCDTEKNLFKEPEMGPKHEIDFNTLEAESKPDIPVIPKFDSDILQGDGFYVKENVGDASDNDDFVPEPIPKDYPEIMVMEGKQFLAALGLVESLVYWRDPKKSGIVFGSILIILLSLTSFSFISVVAYTSLTFLAAALAFRIYKSVLQAVQKTSEGHPFNTHLLPVLNHPFVTAVFFTIKEYLELDLTINPDRAREISDVVVSNVNKAVAEFRRLFLVEDVIDSIKFGIILWCLTYIGSWFNGLSLLIIAYVGLFTLPKVYENNQAQIDANIDIVKTKINEITDKIRAVVPMGKKAEDAKDKAE